MSESLKFIVAPHIVEDLGLNLYTSLPRVLVEYVANAYDADSEFVNIVMNKGDIDDHRNILVKKWELEKAEASVSDVDVPSLEKRTLPEHISITIQDAGIGMSRKELQDRFLIAGRRRRELDATGNRSAGGRPLMGRKGLGKLAGFGVAQKITIVTKAASDTHATKILLDYNEIIKVNNTNEIPIVEERLEDGGGFLKSGTKVILSKLLYEPMKSRLATIMEHVSDHFYLIKPQEFQIKMNENPINPATRKFAYAWPNPEKPVEELINHSYTVDDGRSFTFSYRLRFTGDGEALTAKDRGVRVYAHERLAAAPSLLDADTNMHGFRMTDYLDGIVRADFIDDQSQDYIATDRQALRWESPLLQPMYDFLSNEIKTACKNRQKKRDDDKIEEVKNDAFTKKTIKEADLSKGDAKLAFRFAALLSSSHKKGVKDDGYKNQFSLVVKGLGQGELLTTLSRLADESSPDFERIITEVTRLTAEQLDGFFRFAKGRLKGIEALKKIVERVDFKNANNEEQLHDLFKKCPWLINPTFFEFLTSNRSKDTMCSQLEKVLKIGASVDPKYDKTKPAEVEPGGANERPDLVFLLGNEALSRLVIVELKAPNTPLHDEHYRQLEDYMRDTKKWLVQRDDLKNTTVEGILIGSLAHIKSKAKEVERLEDRINKIGNQAEIRVYGIDEILRTSERVHRDLLKLQESIEEN